MQSTWWEYARAAAKVGLRVPCYDPTTKEFSWVDPADFLLADGSVAATGSPSVPAATLPGQAVNLGQLPAAVAAASRDWMGTASSVATALGVRLGLLANPYDYGGKGDGTGDDGPAIAAMIREAPHSFIPPGTWNFAGPQLLQVKGRKALGVKGKSILKQVYSGGSGDPSHKSFFFFGDSHPYGFDVRNSGSEIFARLPVTGSIVAGQRAITMTNGSDAATLAVGQTVWVRDSVEFTRTNWAQPDFAQLVRIESISGTTIRFEKPIQRAITTALVSPVGGTDPYLTSLLGSAVAWGLCEDVEMGGLTFQGGNIAFDRTGGYRCHLHDIEHFGAISGPGPNSFVESSIERWRGSYSSRAIEIKMACRAFTMRDIDLEYRPVTGYENNDSTTHFIDIGERSEHIRLDNLRVGVGTEWTGATDFMNFYDCNDVAVTGGRFSIAAGGTGTAPVSFRGHSDTNGRRSGGHRILGNLFDLQAVKLANVYGVGSTQCNYNNVQTKGNTWQGSTTNSQLHVYLTQYCDNFSTDDNVGTALRCDAGGSCMLPVDRSTYTV